MAGMYRLLQQIGMEPGIVCEWNLRDGFCIFEPTVADWKSFGLVIYHHSQYWNVGDEIIGEATCPIFLKYHNITPAHFFQSYHPPYSDVCTRGVEQTKSIIAAGRGRWLTDSGFSRDELIALGAEPNHVRIVPPFNRLGKLLPLENTANYNSNTI